MTALFGNHAEAELAAQLVNAYRAHAAALATKKPGRRGAPPLDLRDWLVGRARRIFRRAWCAEQVVQAPAESFLHGNRGAIRPLDEAHSLEVEFIRLVARLAGANLPKYVRALFDTPGGSIPNAKASLSPADAEILEAVKAIPERHRVVERLANKVAQARLRPADYVPPRRGPRSELAVAIRAQLANGGTVVGIARNLRCSPMTVRRYRSL